MAMTRHVSTRLALALAGSIFLAGCETDSSSSRHLQPIPARTLALMEEKGMRKQDPILLRIFKEESTLEVWKRTRSGRYELLKEYEICRWSGDLGPKIREGDKQAPEGFYTVTPGLMNPKSSYYLSFNLGYPNAFDRAHGRTGAHLMVHGDCLSAGCYAITDEQIAEVYAVAREAFVGGQRAFQVHAYPFRMTPENMARRRDSKHFAFWQNLKEGYDHFEVTRQVPTVEVCNRRYVFNAEAKGGARFDPTGACPDYSVPDSIALAVAAKQRRDNERFAELAQSIPVATAYVPQNGRVRRQLGEPITRVAAAPAREPVVTASVPATVPSAPAQTASAPAQTAAASSTATASVPMPAPRALDAPKTTMTARAFGWLRGAQEPEEAKEAAPKLRSGFSFGLGGLFKTATAPAATGSTAPAGMVPDAPLPQPKPARTAQAGY